MPVWLTVLLTVAAVITSAYGVAALATRPLHTHRVTQLERWHRVHAEEMLRSGDPLQALALADGHREESEHDLKKKVAEAEKALEWATQQLQAMQQELERTKAKLPPPDHIRVLVPMDKIEVQEFGSPMPMPIATSHKEVYLGPKELRTAALMKLRETELAHMMQAGLLRYDEARLLIPAPNPDERERFR